MIEGYVKLMPRLETTNYDFSVSSHDRSSVGVIPASGDTDPAKVMEWLLSRLLIQMWKFEDPSFQEIPRPLRSLNDKIEIEEAIKRFEDVHYEVTILQHDDRLDVYCERYYEDLKSELDAML